MFAVNTTLKIYSAQHFQTLARGHVSGLTTRYAEGKKSECGKLFERTSHRLP
ncbi:hypothetical protein HETIRDRAFT_410937, partial [Heterobasidion irregulare TC 32-1]